jgi:hypothetical protein
VPPSGRASPMRGTESVVVQHAIAVAQVRSGAPVAMSEDDAALLVEMSELRLLSQGANLELTGGQWSALAAVTLGIQAIRQAYEAQIATSTVVGPGRFRVEIPMYASAGDAIRARFLAGLQMELGETTAAEIVGKLGSRLEGHFAGFGVGVQTLDITGDPRGARPECEVTRTVKYWNSVEGGDRLTTRRETHFPGWEDPSGESWGPLLAIVGA